MFVNCTGVENSVFSFVDLARSTSLPYLFYTLDVFEHFFVQVLNLAAGYYLFLCWKLKVWHENMNYVTTFFVSTIFWCTMGRTIVLFLNLGGAGDGACTNFFKMAVFLQILYAGTTIHVMPAVVFERWMAFYFIQDYETRSRPYIPAIPIFVSLTIGLIIAITVGPNDAAGLTVIHTVIYGVVMNAFFFVLFLILWKMNSDNLKTIEVNGHPYTLSRRFQLVENIKVFKLLRNVTVSILLVVGILGIFKVIFPHLDIGGIRYESYLLTPMMWGQTIVILVVIWSIDTWWNFTKELICIAKSGQKKSISVVPVNEEANIYFDQLYKSWKCARLENKNKIK